MLEDAPSIPISERYVAFCDILGFSSQIEDNFEHTIRAYDEFISFLSQEGLLTEVESCVYSDAILITSENLSPVVSAVRALWFVAQQHNFLIRGGIAHGRYWERRIGGHFLVVSDAMVRAVKIEASVKFPMVAIDSNIDIPLNAWVVSFRDGNVAAPILHYDGHNIVNPFNPFWFRSASTRIGMMKEETGRAPEKYDWILKLHASVDAGDVLVPQEVVDKLVSMKVLKVVG
jgi:hypothetical protein